jgi:hypothetical protein
VSASPPRISSSQQGLLLAVCLIDFVQWSRHLEKNHTKLTNQSSNNFKGLKFYYLVLKKKNKKKKVKSF